MKNILFLIIFSSVSSYCQTNTYSTILHGDTVYIKNWTMNDSIQVNFQNSQGGNPAFSSITGQPTDNTNLSNALGLKLDVTAGASTYQPLNANLTTFAGINPAANVQSLLAAADYAAFKNLLSLGNVTNESKATMFTNATFTGTFNVAAGSISNAALANSAVENLSGTNTGDNAANSTYASDYRAANFIAGTNYQSPLVSGTNIKTVNGNSVLGSGDLSVSASAAGSGSEIQYRNSGALGAVSNVKSDGTNILRNSDDSPIVYDNDVKGGAANLNSRLGVISNFASPNAGGIVTGQYYDNSFHGSASGTLASAANRIDLAPYYTSVALPIDRIGVAVSTAVAASLAKVVIYSSDANGWPDVLLYESGDLDCSTTGMKEATLSFTFSSGTQYWVGVRTNSTQTLRTVAVASAVNLGLTSSSASNYATILRRTLTYATAATSPWVFTNTDRTANVTPPSIRFRAQ